MKVSGVSESVEVTAASTVDVKSSSTDTNISSDLLTLMPIYSSTSTGLLNTAPGINSSSAYGAQASYGNALLHGRRRYARPGRRFGLDVLQPEPDSRKSRSAASARRRSTAGSPAAIINTVTKSGGNAFSGLFSMRYTNDSLASQQHQQDVPRPRTRRLATRRSLKKLVGLHRPDGRPAEAGQGVLLRQRPAVFGDERPDRSGRELAPTSARAST